MTKRALIAEPGIAGPAVGEESQAGQTGTGPLHVLDERECPLGALPASFTGGEVEILCGVLARQQYERTGAAVPACRA